MPKFTQQQIDEQYQKLPLALREAAYGSDIANKIYEIGQKFALTIEEMGFLAEEATYVILGLVRPENFARQLEERLKTDDEEAAEIVKEINQQIFLPLREALKLAHNVDITEKAISTKPTELSASELLAPTTPPRPVAPATIIPKEEVEKIKKEFSRKPFVSPVAEEKLPKIPPPPPPPRPIEVPTRDKQGISEIQKTEPIPPPPPINKPKITPIDLRQGVKPRPTPPEVMRGVIFAPPAKKPAEPAPSQKPTEPKAQEITVPELKPQEKKPLIRSFDPYREPME